MVMERNKLVLIALLCLAPLLGFAQTSRNPYTTNQNTGIIHNVVPIDGGGRDSTNWNTLAFTNSLIGEPGSVATFSTFTGAGSNVSLFLSTIINGTNYINGVLNASNSLGLFYDVVIGHSLVAPGPLSIYDDLTGTNLLFVTPSNAPTGNGMSLVSTNWVNPSIWNAVWSPVSSPTAVTNAIRTVLSAGVDASGATNIYMTNVISQAVFLTNTEPGCLVFDATQPKQLVFTNSSFSMLGFSNTIAGRLHSISICVSNSGGAIVITGPPATRYPSAGSTNSLAVGAGKLCYWSFDIWPGRLTNCVNCVEP